MKPVTLAGAIAMLELGLDGGGVEERLTDAAIASLRDMQQEASRISPGDDRILSLFREWVAASRHMAAVPGEAEEECKAAIAVVNGIEDTINETPSSGAAGLAIKSYLSLHIEAFYDPKDAAALGDTAINYEVHASILADAIRFVPELAPLAAPAFAARAAFLETRALQASQRRGF